MATDPDKAKNAAIIAKARHASRSIGGAPDGRRSRSSRASETSPSDGRDQGSDLDRALVERAVRNGSKTPSEAEQWAKENGLSKFAPHLEARAWDLEKRLWPFQLAVIWVACRNTERAIQAWNDFCFWRGHIFRNEVSDVQELSFVRAEFELFQKLEHGSLGAEGHRSGRQSQRIDPPQWQAARWTDEAERKVMILRDGEEYYEILVPREVVLSIWPAFSQSRPGSKPAASVSMAKLSRFMASIKGRKTQAQYLALARAQFPNLSLSRDQMREAWKFLPEDMKFGIGKGTEKLAQ